MRQRELSTDQLIIIWKKCDRHRIDVQFVLPVQWPAFAPQGEERTSKHRCGDL